MAQETQTFRCGHTAQVPPEFFGRGAARVRRLAAYFDRRCYACAVDHIQAEAGKFTDRNGNPQPAAIVSDRIARWTAKLRPSYHHDHRGA